MSTIFKDAEASVYALEAAACFFGSISEGNYSQACLDALSLFGWVKNALDV